MYYSYRRFVDMQIMFWLKNTTGATQIRKAYLNVLNSVPQTEHMETP